MALPPAALPLLSGLFAALVAVGVTRAIELLGGTLGGLIATLPTTVVPAALGVALSGGCSAWPLAGAAQACNSALLLEALFSLPQGMLASCLFLTLWRYAPARLPPALSRAARLRRLLRTSQASWSAGAVVVYCTQEAQGAAAPAQLQRLPACDCATHGLWRRRQ